MNIKCLSGFRHILKLLIVGFFVLTASADDDTTDVLLTGYGNWCMGQVVKGRSVSTLEHKWINSAGIGFVVVGKPVERLSITLQPQFNLYFPSPERLNAGSRRIRSSADVRQVNGNIPFGDVDSPFAELRLGIFTYNYNPDVKDFGGYLFRTGTYPPFVINNFDFTAARLCGIQLRTKPFANLTLDALFLSELEYYPLYDFSLAFLADYNAGKLFSVGAGVDFARLIPVDDRKTTVSEKTPYITKNEGVASYKKNATDSLFTGRYSFKATKLMARASFDFKDLFPSSELLDFIFGKEDGKLYGEIALTGFPIEYFPDSTNPHPNLYGKLSRFMPMMAGVNIPTCKILDALSVEVEYFPSEMPNDFGTAAANSVPLPDLITLLESNFYDPADYKERSLGWVIYAKKVVNSGFSIVAQAAYDHTRLAGEDGYDLPYEQLRKKGDWLWLVKAQFSF